MAAYVVVGRAFICAPVGSTVTASDPMDLVGVPYVALHREGYRDPIAYISADQVATRLRPIS